IALRRNWRGVIAASTVAIAANLMAIAALGFDCVENYYLKVGPFVASRYSSNEVNYSSWTLGKRLFVGFGDNFWVPPLWPSMSLALVLTYFIPIAVLYFGIRLALRGRCFDTAFGLLVGVGILISPIAWTYYLTLAMIPIAIIARRLWVIGYPRRISYLAFCLWLLLSIAGATYSYVARLFANHTTSEGVPIVPVSAGLVTLTPAVALIGLLWLIWRLDNVKAPPHDQIIVSTDEAGGQGFRYS